MRPAISYDPTVAGSPTRSGAEATRPCGSTVRPPPGSYDGGVSRLVCRAMSRLLIQVEDLSGDVLGDGERGRGCGRRRVAYGHDRAASADPEVVDQRTVRIDGLRPDPRRRRDHV